MKKRVLAALLAFAVSTNLLACGKKVEEPVKEELETPVVEEAKAEPEPVVEEKEREVVEEEPEEPEKDYSYVQLYLTEIGKLHNSGQADRFALVNVDGDDVPELVACNSLESMSINGEYYALYTAYNENMKLLISDDVSFEGHHIAFFEGKNIVETGGAVTGEHIYYCTIDNGQLKEVFSYQNFGMPEEGMDDFVYHYFINDNEVDEEVFNKETRNFLKEYNGCTRIEIGSDSLFVSKIDENGERKDFNEELCMTYEKITEELTKLRNEVEAEKYKDAEPWKLAYRNCLYDIMSRTILLSDGSDSDWWDYGNDVIFTLYDLTDDGIPELLASGNWPVLDNNRQPYWNIFFYDGNKSYRHDYWDNMEFYDTETKKIYGCGGNSIGGWYYSSVIHNGYLKNKSMMSCEDSSGVEENLGLSEDGYIYEYTEYDENGNEKSSKVVTKNDWNSFIAGYNAGLEKYGIKDYVELTPENIDKELGLSSESTESKKQSEKSDNSLYTVEVTAPDGYVNFRTGAGTDYEIISPISNGETLSVISDEGKWLQVEYQGKTGWVASSQVTKKAENDADSLLDKFINGEIPAYRHDEYTGKTSSFKITDLPIDEDDSYSYHIGERIDLDNDGEKELILDGADGGMYLDAQNGKIIVLAESDGTASRLSHVTYDGAIWIVYSDTSHAGRQWYELKKYNGAGDVVDSFELSAEYWDSPNDQYNTNSDFHYRGKKISMQEYEDLIKRIFGR